jgi:tRNA nucleotidyltransferase/poly(A) polymerase
MTDFFKGPMGEALRQVVNLLWSSGYEAYLAGGCVRDYLLNRPFKDIDIATNAKPEELIRMFPAHIRVGQQFGIIIVVVEHFKFEVATFRTDGDYLDGRHPENISFASAEEDAKRRDFSINALFFDLNNQKVIDFVGGVVDLEAKIIRAVGDPHKRFKEDYLRILRALRFKVQLNFQIETQTWLALTQEMSHIHSISGERISEELFRGLLADSHSMAEILHSSGAWDILFSYLGKRNSQAAGILVNFKEKIRTKGEAFAFLILQTDLIKQSELIIFESRQKIKWSLDYEVLLQKLNGQFKLSREDLKTLKFLGASWCWNKNWQNLRAGFRYELLAMPENQLLVQILLALGADKTLVTRDLHFAQNQPRPFLTGTDVEKLDARQRGRVLKESFYLQWEQKINSRTEALNWLNNCS